MNLLQGLFRMSFVLLLCISPLLTSCAGFNKGLTAYDRLLISSAASNSVYIYGLNSSTGALISPPTRLSTVAPALMTASPIDGTFFVYGGTKFDCYTFSFRTGSAALGSSVTIANLLFPLVSSDGLTVMYGKTGSANLFWRSLSGCTLGTEKSVATAGLSNLDNLMQSDDGATVVASDSGAGGFWRFVRNTSTGALTLGVSNLSYTLSSPYTGLSPDGTWIFNIDGSNINVLRASTLGLVSSALSPDPESLAVLSNTRVVRMRAGHSHQGYTVSAAGVIVANGQVNLGPTNFIFPVAMAPSRSFYYSLDANDGSVWVHKATAANPYVTVTETPLPAVPNAIAYLPGFN